MSNSNNNDDDGSDDSQADDQRWFDLMAGRAADDVRPGTRTEASWLRAAVLAYRPRPPAGAMPDPAERARSLIAKARSAGVLHAHAPATGAWPRLWLWLRQPRRSAGLGLAMAAVLAVAVLRPGMQDGPPGSQPHVLRGPAQQQLQAADPALRQQQLIGALRAAGLDALPYEQLGRLGVDVALPVQVSAGQTAAMVAQGLRVPAGPSLRVEIAALPAASAASAASTVTP